MNTLNFPKRYESKFSSLVVEFTSLNEGTVVVSNDVWKLGYISNNWTKCTDRGRWEPIINLKDIV